MTGRELIIYILKHNLEEEIVFKDGFFLGFMNQSETAVKFGVGSHTIRLWYELGLINGIKIGEDLFFLQDIEDPRTK